VFLNEIQILPCLANPTMYPGVGQLAQNMPKVYATCNPADKDAIVVLSGANPIARGNAGSAGRAVRSTIGKSSGK
jgi:hypothetical protein